MNLLGMPGGLGNTGSLIPGAIAAFGGTEPGIGKGAGRIGDLRPGLQATYAAPI